VKTDNGSKLETTWHEKKLAKGKTACVIGTKVRIQRPDCLYIYQLSRHASYKVQIEHEGQTSEKENGSKAK
jgi:hypothetical protein